MEGAALVATIPDTLGGMDRTIRFKLRRAPPRHCVGSSYARSIHVFRDGGPDDPAETATSDLELFCSQEGYDMAAEPGTEAFHLTFTGLRGVDLDGNIEIAFSDEFYLSARTPRLILDGQSGKGN